MRNPPVKKGDTIFIVTDDLDDWDYEDTLIYQGEVKIFEKASPGNYNQAQVILADGNSTYEWFLTKDAAKQKILGYINNESKRLEYMRSQIT